jgi:adenylate kinase family enzyme
MQNENGNRTIAQIQAFDRDIEYKNSHILYRLNEELSDPEAINNFYVETNGTIWTIGEHNKTSYRLIITAYNNETAWNSTTYNEQDFQIDIQVISINDKEPGKVFEHR